LYSVTANFQVAVFVLFQFTATQTWRWWL